MPLRSLDRRHIAEVALWVGAAVGGAIAFATWHRPPPPAFDAAPRGTVSRLTQSVTAGRLGDLRPASASGASYDPFRFADHDPFRLTHRPAEVAFGAPPPTPTAPAASFAPPIGPLARPRLALLGIVGGAGRWEAVLGGAPGHDAGALVRAGDTLGGLHVRRVTAESVVVQTRDTVWRLALSRAGAIGERP